MKIATKKKRVDPRTKPAPPRFNPWVIRVKFFLRVKNINLPHKKSAGYTGSTRRIRPILSSLIDIPMDDISYL